MIYRNLKKWLYLVKCLVLTFCIWFLTYFFSYRYWKGSKTIIILKSQITPEGFIFFLSILSVPIYSDMYFLQIFQRFTAHFLKLIKGKVVMVVKCVPSLANTFRAKGKLDFSNTNTHSSSISKTWVLIGKVSLLQ